MKFLVFVFASLLHMVLSGEMEVNDDGRSLREIDRLFPDDVCRNGRDSEGNDIYGPCIQARFPRCGSSQLICYNRIPRQDKFYPDRLPYYYIDYDYAWCYPNQWGGCSSCTPGRYCLAENRCVLDEIDYPCARWL